MHGADRYLELLGLDHHSMERLGRKVLPLQAEDLQSLRRSTALRRRRVCFSGDGQKRS
jgi:hypothetical protein